MENIEKYTEVWENCLEIIQQLVEPQQFQTWFRPVKAVSLIDSKLTLEVPTDFFREYLESAFIKEISSTMRRVIGPDARLEYMIRPVQNQPAMRIPSNGAVPVNKEISVASNPSATSASPFVYPGLQRLKINPRLNPENSFDSLVCGECNKLAVSAGEQISLHPGKTFFNPLFIYGGPGLGKTHVAQAIGIDINRRFPELVVLYVTGNEFKTQYVEAVTVRNKLVDFLSYYMKIDVLIIDDIQDLQGQATRTAFFNVFNHLHQNGKQLIFTSDRSPAELQDFEERLRSRFKWGMVVELLKPSYDTRLAMLRQRCTREGIDLPDNVLEYIASNVKASFRELQGALITVQTYSAVYKNQDPLSIAESKIRDFVDQKESELTIDKVRQTVCDYFGLSKEDLNSKTRKRQIVQARQIAMYMCRQFLSGASLSTIGSEIGGKDHATVLHACSTVTDLVATDKTFKKYVTDIEHSLAPAE